jgi:predicted nucleic acid-binding protein
MLLVDSSVWVDFFNGRSTPQTLYLRDHADRTRIATGDLILCEVLQGFRSDQDFHNAKELLLSFHYFDMGGQVVALQAAQHYRLLRQRGIMVRKTIDMLIAAFCVSVGLQLLHSDRDFDALEEYLGLQVVHP